MTTVARILTIGLAILAASGTRGRAQDELVERQPPPALDDFETDANGDGVPDGWYNARDVVIAPEGGKVGSHCLKFETRKPGRGSRLSRAFGIDGRKTEAIVIGLWVRANQIQTGERQGDDPQLMIDFLGDRLRMLRRGMMGPWSKTVGPRWTRVTKRIPVPPGTLDAIMSIGLMGATGVLEVDGLTIEQVPVGGAETTNLVVNGDFELGDPAPFGWVTEKGAVRAFPGFESSAAIELPRSGARVLAGLAVPVEPFGQLDVSVMVRGQGLRGAGGAMANLFFLDGDGRPLRGLGGGVTVFRWAGSFDWRQDRGPVPVPNGAVRAVLQFEKSDGNGQLRIDNVSITSSPNPSAGAWIPFHVEDDTAGWMPVAASQGIQADSALDASFLLEAPAGKRGFVTVRDGRLAFTKGGRARFFGVYLLAPTAYQDGAHADALADRLARSGINLVRIGDLDTPYGPDRSLFDDSRDDTKVLDPVALERLDHLIAALKARGIYVALELQSARRFRTEDGVTEPNLLPPGGGGAAEFDPVIGKLQLDAAKALLGHVNPETGLALREDPVLAWVTLAGEISLFDQIDNPEALPLSYAGALRTLISRNSVGIGRRAWQAIESAHWKSMAEALRKERLRVPIAGVSHWRREAEFSAAQAGAGLDLVDDRLYWMPPSWDSPGHRSLLWSFDGGLAAGAASKRKSDRPYVVGQWCPQTMGAWALPYEAADVMLASEIALAEDWDALVRRGVFVYPDAWGAAAAGTGGGEDIYQIPEVINGIPQVYALWPHAASLMLRPQQAAHPVERAPRVGRGAHARIEGWEPARGRLVINTPYTQGLAGWPADDAAVFEHLVVETDNPFAVVVASSVGAKPIATASRLLVTAIARVQPTDFRWVDEWKREVADPGRNPLIQEPVRAKVLWRRKGKVTAYPLDNNGVRGPAARLEQTDEGFRLSIAGTTPTFHWELVAE